MTTIEPKRQEWVIRRFREERDGKRFFYYVGDFRRAYGSARAFAGFQLLNQGYEARGAYWKNEALRFPSRKAAKAFLYLLTLRDSGSGWHIARIDIYRVRKRVRRERVSP